MKTIKDVKTFFERDLKTELDSLEEDRLDINKRYSFKFYRTTLKILGVLCVTAIITSISVPNSPLRWGTMLIPFTAVVAIVYPIILVSLRARKFKTVNRKYKETIIPRLLMFVQPRLTYFPDKGLEREAVDSSRLFENEGVRFRSEDLVEGSVGGFGVRFADVGMSRSSRVSHTSRKYKRVIIFSGLFFQVDLERQMSSSTFVMPDIREGLGVKLAKKIFGDAAKEAIEMLAERIESLDSELIKMADQRFEKFFSVYTQNEKDARTLLTPSLMHVLSDFREKCDQIVQVSFTGRYLNLAVDVPDMFESGVDDSFLRFENFSDYIEILLLFLNVISEIPSQPLFATQANSGDDLKKKR